MLLPVGGGTDVDSPGLASWLELVSEGDVVAEQTVSRHLDSDDSSENRPWVDPDPHLQGNKLLKIRTEICSSALTSFYFFLEHSSVLL